MPPRNPTLPGIDNPNGSPQDPNVVRPTNVARLPTNSGRQSSNIGRRPPNAFQSPQFVSPPQRMIVPQQVADLQTQLNQAKQQIQTLQQIQTNVTHPPSQRSIQDKQTIEIKAQDKDLECCQICCQRQRSDDDYGNVLRSLRRKIHRNYAI